jgi:hypothetical protein
MRLESWLDDLKNGSSGKRVPQCYYHHSVVHQIAFARRLAYFFCLSKRSMEKKTLNDAGPASSPALLGGIKRGQPIWAFLFQVGVFRKNLKNRTSGL